MVLIEEAEQKKAEELARESGQLSGKATPEDPAEIIKRQDAQERAGRERLYEHALGDVLAPRRPARLDPDDAGSIWGICNQSGQHVRLSEPIAVTTSIEEWVVKLEFSMKHAVSRTLLSCWKAFGHEAFPDWI